MSQQKRQPHVMLLHAATTGSKSDCVQHLGAGSVTRFNPKHDYPQGCTDYERWKHAKVGCSPCWTGCRVHRRYLQLTASMLALSFAIHPLTLLKHMLMLSVTSTPQAPYDITYCRRYEPWGIIDRRLMPWFDVRFRGYGRNKIVFTAALNASGFAFEVGAHGPVVYHSMHLLHPHAVLASSIG
jgi:Glycosyl-transferase for dystroglycan